jgi:hypothetical protein
MKKINIYENIKNNKSIPLLEKEDLKLLQKPVAKSIYINNKNEEPNKKKHPSDILVCEICGNKYRRAHKTDHNKTKIHKVYDSMNKKLLSLLINN